MLVTISVPVVVGVILVIILLIVVILLTSIFRKCVLKQKPSLLVLGSRVSRPGRYITEMEKDCSKTNSDLLLLPLQDCRSTSEISLIGDHDVFPLLPISDIDEEISLSGPLSIPLPIVFSNHTALYSSVPTNQENSDDSSSMEDNIMSSHLDSNPCLDPKESIIRSTVKKFSKSVPLHYQKYDLSSSGVYSSSDLEDKVPLYTSSHNKIHPMSSDSEASLYDRESSPFPLLLSLSCPNQTTHLSAASVPLQHKCNEKQTLPTDKQIGLVQHILESNDINVLTYPLHLEIVHLII